MKKIFTLLIIIWLLFCAFSAFYTTGLFKKVNDKVIGFANTGLVNSPGAQVAFQTIAKADSQFAVETTGKAQQPQVAEKRMALAMAGSDYGVMPTELFDINLELDQSKVSGAGDMGLRVIFTSFGKIPTPVDMTFDILDSSGKVIHSEKGSTVVQTEEVYNKRISNFTPVPGDYTLRLTTVYNKNVSDEFRQPFKVILVKSQFILSTFWLCMLVLASLVVVLVIIFFNKIFKKFA